MPFVGPPFKKLFPGADLALIYVSVAAGRILVIPARFIADHTTLTGLGEEPRGKIVDHYPQDPWVHIMYVATISYGTM